MFYKSVEGIFLKENYTWVKILEDICDHHFIQKVFLTKLMKFFETLEIAFFRVMMQSMRLKESDTT